jgi:hypothetical protein
LVAERRGSNCERRRGLVVRSASRSRGSRRLASTLPMLVPISWRPASEMSPSNRTRQLCISDASCAAAQRLCVTPCHPSTTSVVGHEPEWEERADSVSSTPRTRPPFGIAANSPSCQTGHGQESNLLLRPFATTNPCYIESRETHFAPNRPTKTGRRRQCVAGTHCYLC